MTYIYIYTLIWVVHNIEFNCMNILIMYTWVLLTVGQLTKKHQHAFKISLSQRQNQVFLKKIMKNNCKIQEKIIFADTFVVI